MVLHKIYFHRVLFCKFLLVKCNWNTVVSVSNTEQIIEIISYDSKKLSTGKERVKL